MRRYAIELNVLTARAAVSDAGGNRVERPVRRRHADRMIAELMRQIPELVPEGEDVQLTITIVQERPRATPMLVKPTKQKRSKAS